MFFCIFQYFSSLSTEHNRHHTHNNHGRHRREWPPSAPHEALRSPPTHWMDGRQPSKLADVFWGGLRVCMPLKALLCSSNDALQQYWSVLRAVHTLNSPKNYIHLLGGLSTIRLTHWIGAQGLMWGTRGLFPPAAAMVCYGCVGCCWQLDANVSSINCRNSEKCLWKYVFIPTWIPYILDIWPIH